METPHVALDVEIPSDVKYIEAIVELAARQCRELHLPPHKCSLNLPVALSEALQTAASHCVISRNATKTASSSFTGA